MNCRRLSPPIKESCQHDLLREKGITINYFLMGGIHDSHVLRQFQSPHHSQVNPFEQLTDEPEIDLAREVLSTGENE